MFKIKSRNLPIHGTFTSDPQDSIILPPNQGLHLLDLWISSDHVGSWCASLLGMLRMAVCHSSLRSLWLQGTPVWGEHWLCNSAPRNRSSATQAIHNSYILSCFFVDVLGRVELKDWDDSSAEASMTLERTGDLLFCLISPPVCSTGVWLVPYMCADEYMHAPRSQSPNGMVPHTQVASGAAVAIPVAVVSSSSSRSSSRGSW